MARQLTLVHAPDPSETGAEAAVTSTVLPAICACLEGTAPVAVLPSGPSAVVGAARTALRPTEPVEPGADLVVVTSGSTGRARAVLLPASAMRASSVSALDRLGGPGSWLLALPASAMGGLQVLFRSALTGRAPAVLERGETLAEALRRLPPGDRHYTSLVPTQLRRFLDREPDALRSFDGVLVGGAATDPELLDRARRAGVAVITTYGMTETAGGCVYDGRPLDGVRVRIDHDGVLLAGPVLALGYRLDPRATAAAFRDGWFVTRDAGRLDDGGRLTVSGRLDDVVLTGGVNVAPAAVEAVLREHPDVEDAVVFGRPDDEWGQRVVAAVVPRPCTAPDLATLRSWVAARLGPPAAPRELHTIAAVPALHTGKPDRRAVAAAVVEGTR